MRARDTIFALSSGLPPAAVAVIRLSGPEAGAALERMTQRTVPPPRRAVSRRLYDPQSGEQLDEALILWLPGPATVTGEDVVELHLHGGRAVVNDTLAGLARCDNLRAAGPGDFTRRAFDNGKLDLSQVEGIADLIAAETATQRRNALAISGGSLTKRAEAWRSTLLTFAAQIEAQLDFSDEDDAATALDADQVTRLRADLQSWVDAPAVERLREGIRVVIAGPPNAGKSTLLNTLAQRPVAITAPIAGTTRDIVEAPVSLDGIPFLLMDTAGLHDASEDMIEREGMRRAQAAIADADIILWLGEPDAMIGDARVVRILARADERTYGGEAMSDSLAISAVTGEGMNALRTELLARSRALLPSGDAIAINRRQRERIGALLAEVSGVLASNDALIQAEHLRRALRAIDELVGRAGIEDMLDALFGSMCIGK